MLNSPVGALGALTVILALTAAPLAQQAILIIPEQEVLFSSTPLISRCNSSTGFGGDGRTKFMSPDSKPIPETIKVGEMA